MTANQLDMDGADQALEKFHNAAVRTFAETMARDHQGVIEQAAALAGRLGMAPKDNGHSRALSRQAARVRDRLAGLDGAAFDRAYMENEVAYHETVIGAVEETPLPNTPLAQGESWSTVASGHEVGRYLCAFHPVMKARLIVDPPPLPR